MGSLLIATSVVLLVSACFCNPKKRAYFLIHAAQFLLIVMIFFCLLFAVAYLLPSGVLRTRVSLLQRILLINHLFTSPLVAGLPKIMKSLHETFPSLCKENSYSCVETVFFFFCGTLFLFSFIISCSLDNSSCYKTFGICSCYHVHCNCPSSLNAPRLLFVPVSFLLFNFDSLQCLFLGASTLNDTLLTFFALSWFSLVLLWPYSASYSTHTWSVLSSCL